MSADPVSKDRGGDGAVAWRPAASTAVIRERAALYGAVRSFFDGRGVLEVETPVLSRYATVDRHIDSFVARPAGDASASSGSLRWLQTSPEFPMKRLLVAGSGAIYQIARVFRVDEQGRHHNPEFSMLEWYRPGFDHHDLMDEVEALMAVAGIAGNCSRNSYRDAFLEHAGFDPLAVTAASCRQHWQNSGRAMPEGFEASETGQVDWWLDLWMSHVVGPQLGTTSPQFIYDFPASQAALARVRAGEPPVAERFELFWQGTELANGFHELTDAVEQRRRFEADQASRQRSGQVVPPKDEALIAALAHGMPNCAGVALGLDRLLMLKLGLPSIEATLAFDWQCA